MLLFAGDFGRALRTVEIFFGNPPVQAGGFFDIVFIIRLK